MSDSDGYVSSEDDVEYTNMWGLAVCEEARECYSKYEIRQKARQAKKWFAQNAVIDLNRKHAKRFRPY